MAEQQRQPLILMRAGHGAGGGVWAGSSPLANGSIAATALHHPKQQPCRAHISVPGASVHSMHSTAMALAQAARNAKPAPLARLSLR